MGPLLIWKFMLSSTALTGCSKYYRFLSDFMPMDFSVNEISLEAESFLPRSSYAKR
jgi:hypothetical protein